MRGVLPEIRNEFSICDVDRDHRFVVMGRLKWVIVMEKSRDEKLQAIEY